MSRCLILLQFFIEAAVFVCPQLIFTQLISYAVNQALHTTLLLSQWSITNPLRHVALTFHGSLCRFGRLFGAKCSKCSKPFSSTDMVMRARDKIFHIDCFRCCVCAKHLVPGDEFALRSEALYCKDDYDCKDQLDTGVTKLGAKSPAGEYCGLITDK